MSVEDELINIFNAEIAKEILVEMGAKFTDEELTELITTCGNNPFNVGLLYTILEMEKK